MYYSKLFWAVKWLIREKKFEFTTTQNTAQLLR